MTTIYEQLIKELTKRLSFCEIIKEERITDPNGPEYIFHLTMYNSSNNLINMRLRLALFEEDFPHNDVIAITTYIEDSYEANTMMFVNSFEQGIEIVEHIENVTKGA